MDVMTQYICGCGFEWRGRAPLGVRVHIKHVCALEKAA